VGPKATLSPAVPDVYRHSGTETCSLDTHTHKHIYPFYSSLDFVRDYPGEPISEPIWILLKQETVGGSGISYANLYLFPVYGNLWLSLLANRLAEK